MDGAREMRSPAQIFLISPTVEPNCGARRYGDTLQTKRKSFAEVDRRSQPSCFAANVRAVTNDEDSTAPEKQAKRYAITPEDIHLTAWMAIVSKLDSAFQSGPNC